MQWLNTLVTNEHHTLDILPILVDCQSLVHLEAQISCDTDKTINEGPIVPLANLRSLSLGLPEKPTILPKLILPALTQISFTTRTTRYCRENLWHVTVGFDTLLNQLGCMVRKLELNDDMECFASRDLVGILAALPSLTELDVADNLKGILPLVFKDGEETQSRLIVNGHFASEL